MGKHSRREVGLVKKTAFASAATIGATAVLSNPAQAAEVVVPNTGMTFQVDGLENVPNINAVPGINQWVPSLAGQGQQVNYTAVAEASPATSGPAAPAAGQGQAIVDAAASKIGSPYVWGATGPNSFDCSGLTSWAYKQVGKDIPRTSQAQAASGTKISRDNLQAGDIVAFYSGASHVGIYTGHGTVILLLRASRWLKPPWTTCHSTLQCVTKTSALLCNAPTDVVGAFICVDGHLL